MNRNRRQPKNPFSKGDVVTRSNGKTGVVVQRKINSIVVQTSPGVTEVWYHQYAQFA